MIKIYNPSHIYGCGAIDAFAWKVRHIFFISLSLPSHFPTSHGETELLSTVYKIQIMTSIFRHKTDEENTLCLI